MLQNANFSTLNPQNFEKMFRSSFAWAIYFLLLKKKFSNSPPPLQDLITPLNTMEKGLVYVSQGGTPVKSSLGEEFLATLLLFGLRSKNLPKRIFKVLTKSIRQISPCQLNSTARYSRKKLVPAEESKSYNP